MNHKLKCQLCFLSANSQYLFNLSQCCQHYSCYICSVQYCKFQSKRATQQVKCFNKKCPMKLHYKTLFLLLGSTYEDLLQIIIESDISLYRPSSYSLDSAPNATPFRWTFKMTSTLSTATSSETAIKFSAHLASTSTALSATTHTHIKNTAITTSSSTRHYPI